MLVDFHCHSTASDGSSTPSEIVAEASERGFAALALSDHDNADGIAEFLSAPSVPALKRVAAIELSIDPGEGFDKFHLLALGVDPSDDGLQAFLKRVLEGRNARNERIFENFRRLGIDIRPEPHGEVLARPHFAKWLVEHGHAPDIRSAFERYLLPDSPAETRCYEERFHPPQEEAFRTVHAAGGLAIMAHPKYWRSDWKDTGPDFAAAERALAELREKGLDGLEALYQANSSGENVAFTMIADRVGLVKTAGSDFHGAHKPGIPLGMEVSSSFIAPLLERLVLV